MTIDDLHNRERGFCVAGAPGGLSLPELGAHLDNLLSPGFCHIPVFEAFAEWKPIGVNLDVEDYRVGGTGFIPLHIDFVNAEHPPDIVAFFCAQNDEMSGGDSLVSSVASILEALEPEERDVLRRTFISEGRFFDLVNVGIGLPSFPLLDGRLLRFTGKKVREGREEEVPDIIRRVERLAMALATPVALQNRDILIINQNLSLHGREPLRRRPDGSYSTGRLLYQRFYRTIE